MSAFIVEDDTINKVVSWLQMKAQYNSGLNFSGVARILKAGGYDLTNEEDAKRLAHDMFDLNIAGVNARYGEGQAQEFRPLDFEWRFVMPSTPIRTVKALECWRYQCSEGDVPESDLYGLMRDVELAMHQGIVHSLDEYEKASWG